MIGVNIDYQPDRSPLGASMPGLPLLAPGAVMVVMGDSLADCARAEYSHPLFWALAREQRLDFVYRGMDHCIAIGTSGLDADPAVISGTAPFGAPTRRGLLHPERLARDVGIVQSAGASVVLTDIGTNTFRLYTPAQAVAFRAELDAALFAAGVERIVHGVIAPKAGLTVAEADAARAHNQALHDYAAGDPRLLVYDGHQSELDPALGASNYAPIGGAANIVPGASTSDGVHWLPAHGARRGPALRAALEQIFPTKPLPAYSLADVYSYAGNRYANALGAHAGFGGSSDALPAGATGLEPLRWDVLGASLPAEINLVIENDVDVDYGGGIRKGCRLSWNGTPASSGSVELQAKTYPPAGTDADHKLRLDGTERIRNSFVLAFDAFAGCTGIGFRAYGGIAGTGGGGAGLGGGFILPALNGRYIWSEQTGSPVTSGQTTLFIYGGFSFTAGVPVSGSATLVYAEFGHEAP